MYEKQSNYDNLYCIDTGIDYSMQYDIIDYVIQWCECNDEAECKTLLQNMFDEKQIFLGEFIKAILKINNISSELEKVCEIIGDNHLLTLLKQIPQITLKFVATNQSLYV